jgi:hypothetical protein
MAAKEGAAPITGVHLARKRLAATKNELRADWVIEEWKRDPSVMSGAMIDAIRKRFGCGIVAAKRSLSIALARRRAIPAQFDLSTFMLLYMDLYEQAKAKGQTNAARRVLDSMTEKLGIGAAKRLELGIGIATTEQLGHVAVLQLTPAQRHNRERELALREGTPAGVVIDTAGVESSPEPEPDAG